MMIELQKGDYIPTADIKDKAEYHAIVERVIKAGFNDYGAVGVKRLGTYGFLMIDHEGDLIGQGEVGAKECGLGNRQLTPTQILATPQWVPEVGGLWEHHSGRVYEVTGIANKNTVRPEEYPVTVIYKNVDNDTVWCRPISEWCRSLKPLPTEEYRAVEEIVDDLAQAGCEGMAMKHYAKVLYAAGYRKQPQPEEDVSDNAALSKLMEEAELMRAQAERVIAAGYHK